MQDELNIHEPIRFRPPPPSSDNLLPVFFFINLPAAAAAPGLRLFITLGVCVCVITREENIVFFIRRVTRCVNIFWKPGDGKKEEAGKLSFEKI